MYPKKDSDNHIYTDNVPIASIVQQNSSNVTIICHHHIATHTNMHKIRRTSENSQMH